MLLLSYLGSAFSFTKLSEPLQVVLFALVVLLALRTSPLGRQRTTLIGAVVAVGSVGAMLAALTGTRTGYGISDVWKGLVLLLSAVLIVRRVLARPTVTIQSIYGALSAYLIVGLMFAALYAAMQHLSGSSFFVDREAGNTQTFQYFSFTTLTTLGYGDFTAASDGGRAIAVIEALAGQVFLATLVARLVAGFRPSGEGQRRQVPRHQPRHPARRASRKP
ncbi:MAG TPA: potassium channel family protein [Streptosporangiaceae bacterium]|nr:potassium channel family protein [Streptosporangiaceae bacterium]